eukprot:m.155368 g.155368  ORF g.155368 m.155368 type:complete len:399 (+) comp30934_c0_seq1:80-1276(+)
MDAMTSQQSAFTAGLEMMNQATESLSKTQTPSKEKLVLGCDLEEDVNPHQQIPQLPTFTSSNSTASSYPRFAQTAPEVINSTADLLGMNLSEQPRNVYEFGKKLSARVQKIMSEASTLSRWEREEASTNEVTAHVSKVLSNQQEYNRVNLSLHGLNYWMNITNSATTRRLQTQIALQQEQQVDLISQVDEQSIQMSELNRSLCVIEDQNSVLNQSVSKLEVKNDQLAHSVSQVERQALRFKSETSHLKMALKSNTDLLNRSMQEYQQDKKSFDLKITAHMNELRLLRSGRLKQDAVVDTVLGVLSWCLVNTTLIDAPLRLTLVLMPRHKLKKWIFQCMKASTWVLILKNLRQRAQQMGWHNSVGATIPYVTELARAARVATRKALSADDEYRPDGSNP